MIIANLLISQLANLIQLSDFLLQLELNDNSQFADTTS